MRAQISSVVARWRKRLQSLNSKQREGTLSTLVDLSDYVKRLDLNRDCPNSDPPEDDPVTESEVPTRVTVDRRVIALEMRLEQKTEECRLAIERVRSLEAEKVARERELGSVRSSMERAVTGAQGAWNSTARKYAEARRKIVRVNCEKARLERVHAGCIAAKDTVDKLRVELHEMSLREMGYKARWEELRKKMDGVTVIESKEKGWFTDDVNRVVMELMAVGVSDSNVGKVIEIVLRLANARLSELPSKTTVGRMSFRLLSLNFQYVAKSLKEMKGGANTLISDETSKNSDRLQAYLLVGRDDSDSMKYVCLGIEGVATKAARESLDTFTSRLNTIKGIMDGEDKQFITEILISIKNCMSDQASTQRLFNTLLSDLRKKVLPYLKRGRELSREERDALLQVNEFYCQLHIVANCLELVAGSFDEVGLRWQMEEGAFIEVLRLVASHFSERGSGKFHEVGKWRVFMSEKGFDSGEVTFPSFSGNRFNIGFAIAARLFFYRRDLLEYIRKQGIDDDRLMRLAAHLRDPKVVAQIQVAGLLDMLVTGPLIRLSERADDVLDTVVYSRELVEWLDENVGDPSGFFSGSLPCLSLLSPEEYGSVYHENSAYFKKLVGGEVNEYAAEFARTCLASLKLYFEEKFRDFLPNGKWANLSDEQKREMRSVPTNSRKVESVFGMTDAGYHRCHNMRIGRRNALVMTKFNQPFTNWFWRLSKREQGEVLSIAIRKGPELEKQAKEEKVKIAEKTKAEMVKKGIEMKRKEMNELNRKCKLAGAVGEMGYWCSREEMDVKLGTFLSVPDQIKALENQIRFRQKVLIQPEPKKGIFTLRPRGSEMTVISLRRVLLLLMDASLQSTGVR